MTKVADNTRNNPRSKPTENKPTRPVSPTTPKLREGQANTDPTNIYIKNK